LLFLNIKGKLYVRKVFYYKPNYYKSRLDIVAHFFWRPSRV